MSASDRTPPNVARGFSRVAAFFIAYPPLAQGIYYLVIGLWGLGVAIHDLQATSGLQGDPWPAITVSMLIALIGAVLCLAAYRRQGSPEVLLIALGSAVGLITIDLILVLQRRTSGFRLIDAFLELALVVLWVYGWRKAAHEETIGRVAPVPPSQPITSPPLAR
jgi:hypothetical protein